MDSNNSIRFLERNPVPGAAAPREVKRKPLQRARP